MADTRNGAYHRTSVARADAPPTMEAPFLGRVAVALFAFFVFAAQPVRADPFLLEVAPGVYAHQGLVATATEQNLGGIANLGLIVGDEAAAVIDPGGSVAQGRAFLAAVRQVTDKPIRYVVITHVHPDHWFGSAAFEAPGVTFVGHRNLPRALAARGEFYRHSFARYLGSLVNDVRIVQPTLLVADRTELDLGGRKLLLQAWSAAHTDNDLTVLDEKSGVLFTGDLAFLQHTPIVDGSLLGFLAVIDELRAMPARKVVPGHGPIGVAWPAALDPEQAYFQRLTKDLRTLVKKGATVEDAQRLAGQSERDHWSMFDLYNPRNATTGFAEVEWE